ncbi:MAG: hypothetical protein LBQ20_05740 [Rhodanobacter sp.]|jgi:hypothetical protein|nr:hypothetical protein [Rhodanobacter sp.]
MVSTLRMPTLEIFMTKEDEREFSKQLLQALPEMTFIDLDCWETSEPVIRKSIADCTSRWNECALLNKSVTPLERYRSYHVNKSVHGYYEGHVIGPGIIQYSRSKEEDYDPPGFRSGRFAASYHTDKEPSMDTYVKTVYKIFKKGAKKLFFINSETGKIVDRSSPGAFAWPDAIRQYDMVNGKYLCSHARAYCTSDLNTKVPEYLVEKLKERSAD